MQGLQLIGKLLKLYEYWKNIFNAITGNDYNCF